MSQHIDAAPPAPRAEIDPHGGATTGAFLQRPGTRPATLPCWGRLPTPADQATIARVAAALILTEGVHFVVSPRRGDGALGLDVVACNQQFLLDLAQASAAR